MKSHAFSPRSHRASIGGRIHAAFLVFVISLVLGFLPAAVAQDRVTTLAGQPMTTGSDNGSSTNATFNDPAAIVADAQGNLFVTDTRNHAIRKISADGVVTTFAGRLSMPGHANGLVTQAQFDSPSGITRDAAGNFFVTDTGNHTIRKITAAGAVTTFAGASGQSGFTDGLGASARFNAPLGIVVASNGTIYVADCGNHLIRAISPSGSVSTLAGLGETWGSADGAGNVARFNGPVGLALDPQGNLFVSDSNNHTIRKISPDGLVITWAGQAGADGCVNGDRLSARFTKPAELVFDAHGNLFVADSFNHVIRKISVDGIVSTVCGLPGKNGAADGSNGSARLFNPYGLAVRPDGALILTDAYNQTIRDVLVPFAVNLEVVANSATVSWESVQEKKYQVQCKTESAPWFNLTPVITATNFITTVTDEPELSSHKLYRVLVLP